MYIPRWGHGLLYPLCPSDQDPWDEHAGEAAGAWESGGGWEEQAGEVEEVALQDLGGRECGAIEINK